MTCCGQVVRSAFCPHCGKKHRGVPGPLGTLLDHLKLHVENEQQRFARSKTWVAEGKRDERWLARREKALLKWKSWYEAVLEIVESKEKSDG